MTFFIKQREDKTLNCRNFANIRGVRICLTLQKYISVHFTCVCWQSLDATDRGDGGFGSTGTNWCTVDYSRCT